MDSMMRSPLLCGTGLEIEVPRALHLNRADLVLYFPESGSKSWHSFVEGHFQGKSLGTRGATAPMSFKFHQGFQAQMA